MEKTVITSSRLATVPYFPKQVALKAISVFLIALTIISIVYFDYRMSLRFIILSLIWVLGFFCFSNYLTNTWRNKKGKDFVSGLFIVALLLRLLWVVYFYYSCLYLSNSPFEPGAADSLGYHKEAEWLASENWDVALNYYFGPDSHGISDVGYPLYLTVLYKFIGPNVFLPRVIKAILGALTSILIYRISSRTFGEEVGRMAGIMTAFMPNLIIYCGYHLKETEMLFFEVAFLERLDYVVVSKRINMWSIFLSLLLAGYLFFFRTVLGVAAIFAFVSTVLISSTPMLKKGWRRVALIGWILFGFIVFGGSKVTMEVESLWEGRYSNVENKRLEQTIRGNQWAQYATGTIMAPMAFVLPYATMVNVDGQYSQQEKSGGNYIRNFMGFFTLLAIYEAIRRKKWRRFVLIGSFVIAYLGAVSLSGFSNSERFLLPGLPCLIMMWAYGISTLRKKTYSLLTPWCFIVFLMEFGWAYFKLGSRGLI